MRFHHCALLYFVVVVVVVNTIIVIIIIAVSLCCFYHQGSAAELAPRAAREGRGMEGRPIPRHPPLPPPTAGSVPRGLDEAESGGRVRSTERA